MSFSSAARATNGFKIEDFSVEAGAAGISADVLVEHDVPIRGFSVAMDYDEALLDVTAVNSIGLEVDPFQVIGEFEDGRIVLGVVFDLVDGLLPPGVDRPLLQIEMDVIATTDAVTELTFRNGEDEHGAPQQNIMTEGNDRSTSIRIPDLVVQAGTVTICTTPDAPADVTVTRTPDTALVSWTEMPSASVRVERSTDGANYTTLAEIPAGGGDSYLDETVAECVVYTYRLTAARDICRSDPTTAVSTSCPDGIPNPSASVFGATITLSWDAIPGAADYEIERDGAPLVTVPAPGTSYADSDIVIDQIYEYRMRASNKAGTSDWSGVLPAAARRPAAPVLTATPSLAVSAITLTWTDPSGGEATTALFRDGNPTPLAELDAGVTSHVDAGLAPCTSYSYVVRATRRGLDSPDSAPAAASTGCVPAAPCLNVRSVDADSAQLEWVSQSTGPDSSFILERSQNGGEFGIVATIDGDANPSYDDTTATQGSTYDYRLTARNSFGDSDPAEVGDVTLASIALTKAKGKLGKNGWILKLSRVDFDLGGYVYEGDGSEIRVTLDDDLEVFDTATTVKQKVDKKTGATKTLSLKDGSKNSLKMSFKKGSLKLTLKDVPEVSSDFLDVRIDIDDFSMVIRAATEISGKKQNKLLFPIPQSGQLSFTPTPEACPLD